MGRPKGSANKPKEEPEVWSAKPDMGAIKPPAESEAVCGCLHTKATHYGGPKGWCNTSGCSCQTFR